MRATLETAPDKRLWNKAQAIFLCTMREDAGLTKEKLDIRWVSTGIRVSVNSAPLGGLPRRPSQPQDNTTFYRNSFASMSCKKLITGRLPQ